jgi:hypothetical protein
LEGESKQSLEIEWRYLFGKHFSEWQNKFARQETILYFNNCENLHPVSHSHSEKVHVDIHYLCTQGLQTALLLRIVVSCRNRPSWWRKSLSATCINQLKPLPVKINPVSPDFWKALILWKICRKIYLRGGIFRRQKGYYKSPNYFPKIFKRVLYLESKKSTALLRLSKDKKEFMKIKNMISKI